MVVISGKIRAWIKARKDHPGVIVAFVGVPDDEDEPLRRSPATRVCSSPDEGRRWVETEAQALGGVPVQWLSEEFASGD